MLAAILHQDIEIGTHQCRLVAIRYLERRGLDTVALIGLLFQPRVLGRVDYLHPDLAAAGHFVFSQQIPQLWHQGRQQGVGLGTEIPPDQQRFLQLLEKAVGGFRNRVEPALGDVQAQLLHAREPDVGQQQVGQQQGDAGAPVAMPPAGGAPGPAQFLQGVGVEGEEADGEAQVVEQVANIQHAAGDAVKAGAAAQQAQALAQPVVEKVGNRAAANQVQQAAQRHRADQADDGIVCARGYEQAGAEVGGAQQAGGEVAAQHRAPVQVCHQGDGDRQGQGGDEGQ